MYQLTDSEKEFFRKSGIKEGSSVGVYVRIPIKTFIILKDWSRDNHYPVTWIIKKGIQNFIKDYITKNIIPSPVAPISEGNKFKPGYKKDKLSEASGYDQDGKKLNYE